MMLATRYSPNDPKHPRPPAPPVEGPQPKDQINLTDEDSRIMPVAGGGFEQCYNAQAVVATESLLVIATDVVQAPNDKQQIAPMLEKIDALPEGLGQVETLLADNGYFSEANVMVCVRGGQCRTADCGRAAAASSLLARTICCRAAGSSCRTTASRRPVPLQLGPR
jgi:hypothetical protein